VVDEAFVAAVSERELVTDHDVAAFVDVVQAAIGAPAGAWIHYGLTSSDVVDTAWCWMLRDAADLLIEASTALLGTLVELARRHRDTVMIGRTHGVHAEPTTFGAKVALWALQVDRDRVGCGPPATSCRCASSAARSAPTRTSTRASSASSPTASACAPCRPRR
jgi:adenylosuccinate lyase